MKRSNLTTPKNDDSAKRHPEKLAHWIRASRTRKIHGKNKTCSVGSALFAPSGNSV